MLANSDKKHDLVAHCKAVALVSEMMAKSISLKGTSRDLVKDAYLSGLIHDIGKSIHSFQSGVCLNDWSEYSSDMPKHHEISWAFAASKINNMHVLNAVYWHHPKPKCVDGSYYKNWPEILSKLSSGDLNVLESIWLALGLPVSEQASDDVPSLFVSDGDKNSNRNAEFLAIRSCLISADRLVSSSVSSEDLLTIDPMELINTKILNHGMVGVPVVPDSYKGRYSLQKECADKAASITGTSTIIRAPAGFGKTIVGLLWGLKRGRRLIWVCPRNTVADAVYQNILKELGALKLGCSVELYLGGKREKTNAPLNEEEFSCDIVVTNFDNICSPMVKNNVGGRLFLTISSDVIMDEFHEIVSDAPLFSALITYMRLRHRLSGVSTLLLSATPGNVNNLWDVVTKRTLHLPDEGSHYPPAHMNPYKVNFISVKDLTEDSVVGLPQHEAGRLFVSNSVRTAQSVYQCGGYTHLIHSKYTKEDRKKLEGGILASFGKGGLGNESESVSAALVVQAALDISFNELFESMCSPESTVQRIGRINRWGLTKTATINFMIVGGKSESSAIETVYSKKLRDVWVSYLMGRLSGKDTVTLADLYKIYNDFYKEHMASLNSYIREQYDLGLTGGKNPNAGLMSFAPYSVVEKKVVAGTTVKFIGSKSLRSPLGQWGFTVRDSNGDWLPPDSMGLPPFTEGVELRQRYDNNNTLMLDLIDSSKNIVRFKELAKAGYPEFIKKGKKGKMPTLSDWFEWGKSPLTPVADISRVYDSKLGLQKI